MLIVDAHQDLAWNMLSFGRDYTRPVAETRRIEAGGLAPQVNGDALLGWPEYQKGACGAGVRQPVCCPAAPLRRHLGARAMLCRFAPGRSPVPGSVGCVPATGQ